MTITRIALVSDDQKTISAHFGMAGWYVVYEAEDGQLLKPETRAKPHHAQHPDHEHGHGAHGHEDMFAPIADCQVLICGGMGSPAYQKAQSAGLQVILAGGEISAAAQAWLTGKINSDPRRVHSH